MRDHQAMARRAGRGLQRPAGFSLVEVLVALIVISVGLLGVAKMQALALSNTASARLRSLAAIQAASLASSMHADRAYWSAVPTGVTATVSAGAASADEASLQAALTAAAAAGPTYCDEGGPGSAAPCTPAQLAADDLQAWATDFNTLMPGGAQATISCPNTVQPLTCTIQLAWVENLVAVNKQSGQSDAIQKSIGQRAYTLNVQP